MKMDKTTYMIAIIHKLLEDIKAKEIDYGINGVKVQLLLGRDEAQVLLDALEKDGKEPFINKPCISEGVCHEDNVNVLEKIKWVINDMGIEYLNQDKYTEKDVICQVLAVIDRYIKSESEDKE